MSHELQQVPARGCSPALTWAQRTAGCVQRTRPVPAPITCISVHTDNLSVPTLTAQPSAQLGRQLPHPVA